jgi:hypothetical protein
MHSAARRIQSRHAATLIVLALLAGLYLKEPSIARGLKGKGKGKQHTQRQTSAWDGQKLTLCNQNCESHHFAACNELALYNTFFSSQFQSKSFNIRGANRPFSNPASRVSCAAGSEAASGGRGQRGQ